MSDSANSKMDREGTTSNQEQKAHGRVLEGLLSDESFNKFDPMFWMTINEGAEFLCVFDEAFLTLAKYYLAKELDELISGHQWLADLTIPSKRHESAHVFQMNPARCLTILDVVVKLQFMRVYGAAMMRSSPGCGIYYETYKILEAEYSAVLEAEYSPMLEQLDKEKKNETHDLEHLVEMKQDFGGEWTEFEQKQVSLCSILK